MVCVARLYSIEHALACNSGAVLNRRRAALIFA
jgi:hypothetical protein